MNHAVATYKKKVNVTKPSQNLTGSLSRLARKLAASDLPVINQFKGKQTTNISQQQKADLNNVVCIG
ncbi:MAG: hypothetical protein Q8R74_04555 [Methylophilus sp.]|nr:hypothetical protein [Methylophilus sp.]